MLRKSWPVCPDQLPEGLPDMAGSPAAKNPSSPTVTCNHAPISMPNFGTRHGQTWLNLQHSLQGPWLASHKYVHLTSTYTVMANEVFGQSPGKYPVLHFQHQQILCTCTQGWMDELMVHCQTACAVFMSQGESLLDRALLERQLHQTGRCLVKGCAPAAFMLMSSS